jgi:mannose-6-phosphate isomerase
MSIALTPFEAMCGFRPIDEIRQHLLEYPELSSLLGSDGERPSLLFLSLPPSLLMTLSVCQRFHSFDETEASQCQQNLKILFTSLMEATDDHITEHLSHLMHRLSSAVSCDETKADQLNSLMQRLYVDYPNDRGVVCPLILNHLQIQPGEAFFMGSNEPHAYISGDCIECMALSDNTVRAGLTPKHRDVKTLCEMLHYRSLSLSLSLSSFHILTHAIH